MNGLWKVLAFLALVFCLSHTLAAADHGYMVPAAWPLDDAQDQERMAKWNELGGKMAEVAPPPETVADRGNLEQLVLEGNKTFPSKAIQEELIGDFDLMVAAHPAAPWAGFLAMLERKIVAGYRNCGFPAVRVEVRPDRSSGKLLVHIDEGPRYLAGDVKIVGASTLPVGPLADRLTKPYLSKEALEGGKTDGNSDSTKRGAVMKDPGGESALKDPVWEAGKPAHFPAQEVTANDLSADGDSLAYAQNTPKRNHLESEVADAMADLGYFFPRFKVHVAANVERKTAQLVVNILDEGQRAQIGEIDIRGNTINSRDDIVNYLKLRPGDPFDRKNLYAMKQRLLDSGRFVEVNVKPPVQDLGYPSKNDQPLQIEVQELENAPPLGTPLRPEEEVLLKFGKWFGDIDRWQGDLVVQTEDSLATATTVISPHRGVLAAATLKSHSPAASSPDYALVATQDEIGIFSALRGRKVVAEHLQPRFKLIASIAMSVEKPEENQTANASDAKGSEPPGKKRRKSTLNLGLGVKSLDAGDSTPPFALNMKIHPASNMNDAHRPDTTFAVRDGRLSVANDDLDMVIDVSSGRLLKFTWRPATGGPPDKAKKSETAIYRLSFEPGAFDRRLKEVHAMAAAYPNDYDRRTPLASFSGFLADEEPAWNLLLSKVGDEKAAGQLHKLRLLMNRQVMAGVDDLLGKLLERSQSDFALGEDSVENEISPENRTPETIARVTMLVCNLCFPPYSWPWTLGANRR